VEEFHRCYPGKPVPLENVLGRPQTYEGDTVMAQEDTEILSDTGLNYADSVEGINTMEGWRHCETCNECGNMTE